MNLITNTFYCIRELNIHNLVLCELYFKYFKDQFMKRKLLLNLAIFIQFACPTIDFAQAPSLGTSANFTLFTAVGAVDILGTSSIQGDVGTHAGAYTKSPASNITGNVHIANSISAQAATDINAAYTNLSGRTCGVNIPGISSLGTTRKVLGPDTIYCLYGAQTINGDLTLDGEGDSNAVFIIQIDGALSTSTLSRILLINSASFCHVYWQVNGAVSIGTKSQFQGTIIANGAISLLDSAGLNGRALSKAGAISLSNNMVNGCEVSGNILPVVLIKFTAKIYDGIVYLNWATASEINNDFFTIQRTQDQIAVEDILKVKGSGNSSVLHRYSAIDYKPLEGTSFYRIKQTDFDGKTKYSNYISINSKNTGKIVIYPNPFSVSTTISIPDISQLNNCELRVFNVLGEQIIYKSIDKVLTIMEADNLLSELYFYLITSDENIIQSGRMMIRR